MAELKVERKQPSVWPWILGLLVLVLAIFVVAQILRRDRTTDQPAPTQIDVDVNVPNPGSGGSPQNP